jgi:NADPH:quinone reductase-like Zn-dependent oxidoreductase
MTRIVAPVDFGGPEQLVVSEVPTPLPGPGEVRVAVRAIGVNPIDWKIYSGRIGRDRDALANIGFELAGVVDAVGDDVERWAVGDDVIATQVPGNAYTDAAVVPAAGLIAKPEGLSWELAASVPVAGATAAHAVEAAGVGDGGTLLVHGAAGGVGGLVVQLARRRGARVIATASERNHEYLRSLGAEPVTYGEGLGDRVRALAPDGVDAAVDTAGTDEAIDVSLDVVGNPRRVVTTAAYQRRDDGIVLIGGGGDPGTEIRDAARPQVARLLATGELTLPIQATYSLEATAEAHRTGLTGHTRGKLVIVP